MTRPGAPFCPLGRLRPRGARVSPSPPRETARRGGQGRKERQGRPPRTARGQKPAGTGGRHAQRQADHKARRPPGPAGLGGGKDEESGSGHRPTNRARRHLRNLCIQRGSSKPDDNMTRAGGQTHRSRLRNGRRLQRAGADGAAGKRNEPRAGRATMRENAGSPVPPFPPRERNGVGRTKEARQRKADGELGAAATDEADRFPCWRAGQAAGVRRRGMEHLFVKAGFCDLMAVCVGGEESKCPGKTGEPSQPTTRRHHFAKPVRRFYETDAKGRAAWCPPPVQRRWAGRCFCAVPRGSTQAHSRRSG
jgi:hypothetical protein